MNDKHASIMLTQFRAKGMLAFEALQKAQKSRSYVAAHREYFAMGYAMALTEQWKTRQAGSFVHRMRVKCARWFAKTFTSIGPREP